MERIRTMAEGDFLVVATDGALVKVMESTRDAWQSVPQMGGGGVGDWYCTKRHQRGAPWGRTHRMGGWRPVR